MYVKHAAELHQDTQEYSSEVPVYYVQLAEVLQKGTQDKAPVNLSCKVLYYTRIPKSI